MTHWHYNAVLAIFMKYMVVKQHVEDGTMNRVLETSDNSPERATAASQTAVPVLFDVSEHGVGLATINHPDTLNCLDDATLLALDQILDRCETDDQIRILCLAAAGKHFCAGADIRAIASISQDVAPDPSLTGVLRRLKSLPMPTIAMVQGACIGGGVALVACCDMAVAATDTSFSISEVRLGIPPAALLPFLLPAFGPRALKRYALTADRFDADDASHKGFVHQVCERDRLCETTAKIVQALLRSEPRAVSDIKRHINDPESASLESENLSRLEKLVIDRMLSPEAGEGISAFLEKRRPVWAPPVTEEDLSRFLASASKATLMTGKQA
jgi:methylglutaconyl-CoA hydratase